MHETSEDDSAHDLHAVRVADDHYHVDIQATTTEPMHFMFTITEAETGKPVQKITGFLTLSDTNISSELKTDIPEEGRYMTIMRLPGSENGGLPFRLRIGNEQGVSSTYDFTLIQERHAEDQRRGMNITTKALLVGSAMALMMIGKLLVFGVL